MSDRVSNYRELRVIIQPGTTGVYLALMAREVRLGRSSDRLLHRTFAAPLPRTATVEECLRAAARALEETADRL